MRQVNIHEAETNLLRLVEEAARSEAFVIAKVGKPMVKVVPLDAPAKPDPKLRFGFLRGQGRVAKNFDRWMEDEILEMFGLKNEKLGER